MWATEWKMEDALEVRAKEAWEDGLENGKVETAKELLTLGVDVSIISQATKLSVDTVLRLQSTRR